MISASSKAVERLREQLIQKCFEAGLGFRVLIRKDGSGKATFSIKVDKQQKGDRVTDSGDVKLFMDPASAAQINDYQLDYSDTPDGGFFLNITQEEGNGH